MFLFPHQRAFRGPGGEERAFRVGLWARATIFRDDEAAARCKEMKIPIRRAAGEGVGQAGGFLVPDALYREIVNLREQYGSFRQGAEIVPMASDNLPIPRRTGGFTASFAAENTALTESQAAFDNITLTAKKITALGRMSSELAEDSEADIAAFLADEMAYAFAAKEDDCGWNGDGTSAFGGMRGIAQLLLDGTHNASKQSAQSGHNTFLTLDGTDLGTLTSGVLATALPGAAWYCSVTCYAQTFSRLGIAGGALTSAVVDGVVVRYFLGYPVIFTQKLPLISTTLNAKIMLCFGNLKLAAALGERRGVSIARSEHAYLGSDQIGLKGTERFDINVHDLGDNATPGPIAGLVGG